MRTKSNILAWFLSFAAILGVGLTAASCQPEGLTDNSEFSLYYPGITDIGPSTSMNITPTWHGATPADFEIYRITFNGAAFSPEAEVFKIDPVTGGISLQNTDNLQPGTYKLSVACKSGGKRFEFADAVIINMMNEAPEGIKIKPEKIKVTYEEILAGKIVDKDEQGDQVIKPLPTARITTEGEHIHIKKYIISKIYRDGRLVDDAANFFEISPEGIFSIIPENKAFIPGIYEFDFILTTRTVNERDERSLYTKEKNKLVVEVASAPMGLNYDPASCKAIAGVAMKYNTPIPILEGSKDGITFSLAENQDSGQSAEKAQLVKDNVKVNAADGQITLEEGHTLKLGETYKVSIHAENDYGSKDFNDVFEIEIVEDIAKIGNFSYDDVMGITEELPFSNPVKEISGEEITFSFVDLDESLHELQLDSETGTVSAPKGQTLPGGIHTITVKAENIWGPEFAKTASFKLEIKVNPNRFKNVCWGNNLNLAPAEDYASQFRFRNILDKPFVTKAPTNDIPKGAKVKYEITKRHACDKSDASIDPATGVITYKHYTETDKDNNVVLLNKGMEILIVKVTVGEGELALSKQFPVCFDNVNVFKATDGKEYTLEMTPFVIKANPSKGIKDGKIQVYDKDGKDVSIDMLSIDIKRNINFYNLNGPADKHKDGFADGKDKGKDCLIHRLWDQYHASINDKSFSYGTRDPMSWFKNDKDNTKDAALCYFENPTGTFVVNPDRFIYGDEYVNGVVTAQCILDIKNVRYDIGQKGLKGIPTTEPFVLWLDTAF